MITLEKLMQLEVRRYELRKMYSIWHPFRTAYLMGRVSGIDERIYRMKKGIIESTGDN